MFCTGPLSLSIKISTVVKLDKRYLADKNKSVLVLVWGAGTFRPWLPLGGLMQPAPALFLLFAQEEKQLSNG